MNTREMDYVTLRTEIIPSTAEKIKQRFQESMDAFLNIWEKLGVDDTKCLTRIDEIMRHYKDLNEHMLKEEQVSYDTILKEMSHIDKELTKMCNDLGLKQYVIDESMKLLCRHAAMVEELKKLNGIKERRMKRHMELRQKEAKMSVRLDCPRHPSSSDAIPTENFLNELEANVNWLREEEAKRSRTFSGAKERIVSILAEMGSAPRDSFEREVVFEPEENFILSKGNMQKITRYEEELKKLRKKEEHGIETLKKKIELLWLYLSVVDEEKYMILSEVNGTMKHMKITLQQELDRCEQLKRENMGTFVEEQRRQIKELQVKCFLSKEEKNECFYMFDTNYTEELLDRHTEEFKRLKDYHKDISGILDLVAQHNDLFSRKIEFENKGEDPKRWHNRGGRLLQEGAERMRIKIDLPKVKKDLEKKAMEWEDSNRRAFCINGSRVLDSIQRQWDEYSSEKENEKLEKARARAQKLENEVLNGTKPILPMSLKRTASNISKTPNKFRKGNGSIVARRRSGAGKASQALKAIRRNSRNNKSGSPSSTLGTTLSSYDEFSENINKKAQKDQCRSSVLACARSPKPSKRLAVVKTPKGLPFLV